MRPVLFCLLLLALSIALSSHAPAKDEDDELVRAELATVGFDRLSEIPVVLLREPDSGQVVPIFIGLVEAQAILHGLHGVQSPRPMTHDLLANTLDALDATLSSVQVHSLRGHTYHGRLVLSVAGREQPVHVDTRPSDGLALAMRTGAIIEVSKEILRRELDFDFRFPEGGRDVVRAAGITVVEATAGLREEMGLPDEGGVLVSQVGAEAHDKGLRAGDLLLAVGDRRPDTPMAFLEAIRAVPTGKRVTLRFWREGETREIELSTEVPTTEESERRRL